MADTQFVLTHTLDEPIEFPPNSGTKIETIKFRKPRAGDITRCGQPVTVKGMGTDAMDIVFHEQKMTNMMASLADCTLPPPAIETLMSSNDWTVIAYGLAPFFVPMERKT